MKIRLTEELWKEGNMYVSYCPELDIASCGESIEQAKKNLKEVISINLEEAQKMGTFDRVVQEAGFDEIEGAVLSLRKELVGFTPIVTTVFVANAFLDHLSTDYADYTDDKQIEELRN